MPTITLAESNDSALLVPLLHDAEEAHERISAELADNRTVGYVASDGEIVVGAVVVRWDSDASEIMYIQTDEARRGQGYGKAMIAQIAAEAKRRGAPAISVGTGNSSFDNIAFYQKCGFRIDAVRKDYFDYLPHPIVIEGIPLRDMLVLRLEL